MTERKDSKHSTDRLRLQHDKMWTGLMLTKGSQYCIQAAHLCNLGEFRWSEGSCLVSFVLFHVPKLFRDCLLPTRHIDKLDGASALFFPAPRRLGAFGDVRQEPEPNRPHVRAGPQLRAVVMLWIYHRDVLVGKAECWRWIQPARRLQGLENSDHVLVRRFS